MYTLLRVYLGPLLQTSQDTNFFGLRVDFGFETRCGAVDLGSAPAVPCPPVGGMLLIAAALSAPIYLVRL